MNFTDPNQEAAQHAWMRLRHLLKPDTVHLLTVADLADAIAMATQLGAPAEKVAAVRIEGLLLELETMQRENARVREERDEAMRAADCLAYSVGSLTGEDLGAHAPGNNPWQRSLELLDEIAVANHRPRPSDIYSGEAYA